MKTTWNGRISWIERRETHVLDDDILILEVGDDVADPNSTHEVVEHQLGDLAGEEHVGGDGGRGVRPAEARHSHRHRHRGHAWKEDDCF